jgi:hypothetical protein
VVSIRILVATPRGCCAATIDDNTGDYGVVGWDELGGITADLDFPAGPGVARVAIRAFGELMHSLDDVCKEDQ